MKKGEFYLTALFLTDCLSKGLVFLTLIFCCFCQSSICYASDFTNGYDHHDPAYASLSASPLANSEQRYKMGLLINYIRAQVPIWLPGLPVSSIATPNSLMLSGLRSIRSQLGADDSGDQNEPTIAATLTPPESMLQMPSLTEPEALWLTPDYHHKGFLPFNDAMIMGVSLRRSLLEGHVQMDFHPYYGQNWISTRGYYGQEIALNVSEKMGPIQGGKIAINYIVDDSNLSDHGHGINLHGDLKFSDTVGLQAGVRENDNAQLGNYVMVKWTLLTN